MRTLKTFLAGTLLIALLFFTGPSRGAFPGSNGRISFARFNPAIGDFQIYVANPDGSHETQLTTLGSDTSDWSPDGQRIAFDFFDPSSTSGNIGITNADGSGFVQLTHVTNDGIVEPAWSPDGTRLAVGRPVGDHPHDICIISAATGAILSHVTANPFGWFDGEPRWSPDGQWIAFDRVKKGLNRTDLVTAFVVRSDGTGLRQLASWGRQVQYPDWSPDGSRLVVTSRSEPGAPASIFTVRPDGSGLTLVVKSTGLAGVDHPRWSPDGTRIIFQGCPNPTNQPCGLWSVDADGSNLSLVTSGASFPAWGTHPAQ